MHFTLLRRVCEDFFPIESRLSHLDPAFTDVVREIVLTVHVLFSLFELNIISFRLVGRYVRIHKIRDTRNIRSSYFYVTFSSSRVHFLNFYFPQRMQMSKEIYTLRDLGIDSRVCLIHLH